MAYYARVRTAFAREAKGNENDEEPKDIFLEKVKEKAGNKVNVVFMSESQNGIRPIYWVSCYRFNDWDIFHTYMYMYYVPDNGLGIGEYGVMHTLF